MPFSLPSIPYPPSGDGVWNPVTATINWCEEDYYVSPYVAEVVNTFTNAIFVYLALVGIFSCVRNKHPGVFLVAYIGYMIIGVASIFYHTTLKYWMQLFDELSMIYTTCILFFAVFSHGKSTLGQTLLGLFVTSLAVFITGYYHYLGDPVFHQVMFGILTATVVFRSLYIMEKILRPKSEPQSKSEHLDVDLLKTMWTLITCGLSAIAIGFLTWNLDNIFCSQLRAWRRELGLPWGVLLEGHGWWHLFTGIACYINVTYGLWLRYCRDGKKRDVVLVWPSMFGSVPTVERIRQTGKDSTKLNGKME
ncbi:alkaline phytoceramidase [Colletotrichum asianum]|uniref:Alkaline phytoceramidase n=1 Tax=Colletotrichum asianum TaxID=702518 RepID=A0A8H3WCX9_9PEZI|nr:alkaline phytoceramidase [Colletotrichum asianum]